MAQQWGVNPDLPYTNPGMASNQLLANLRNEAQVNKTMQATKRQALANYIRNGAVSRPNDGHTKDNTLRGNPPRFH